MLQNSRIKAFTVSELLRENQQGGVGVGKITPTPTLIQIRVKLHVKVYNVYNHNFHSIFVD